MSNELQLYVNEGEVKVDAELEAEPAELRYTPKKEAINRSEVANLPDELRYLADKPVTYVEEKHQALESRLERPGSFRFGATLVGSHLDIQA